MASAKNLFLGKNLRVLGIEIVERDRKVGKNEGRLGKRARERL